MTWIEYTLSGILIITSCLIVLLVLLHKGKGGGLSDLFGGGVSSSLGGSSVAERNLDRITIALLRGLDGVHRGAGPHPQERDLSRPITSVITDAPAGPGCVQATRRASTVDDGHGRSRSARGKWQCHPWQPGRSRTDGRGGAW